MKFIMKYFLIVFLVANTIFAAEGEIWLKILRYVSGNYPNTELWGDVTVELYKLNSINEEGFVLDSSGPTTWTAGEGGSNAWTYFADEPASGATFGPVYR